MGRRQQPAPLRGLGFGRGRGRGALEADPRLVPARRPAAGPLRRGAHAAARRRLHRPAPARRPPRRLRRPRRRGRRGPLDRAEARRRRAAPLRDLHGRALGDGHRERADGGGADARADDDLQRRQRAARPGPRPPAQRDGGRGQRDRLQRDDGARPRPARRRRAHDLTRPHRGRQLHGPGGGDRRRAADPRRRAGRPADGATPVPPPRARIPGRWRRRDRPARASPCGSRPTSATRSRRSRTAPGPPSRPT